jgi:glycosyltransferase involved in cell wall biosynthesis
MIASSFFRKKQKWIKFAGNWSATLKDMAPSHFFQREWLKLGMSDAIVTVNGVWENQPNFVVPFLNPSANIQEIITAREKCIGKRLVPPYRIVFVGHMSPYKGLQIALNIVKHLNTIFPDQIVFNIVGDGPERSSLEEFVNENNLQDFIHFHGWIPHSQVFELLTSAHFLLLPTASEGWPKILSEAMIFGVVPLASAISSIPQLFSSIGSGIAISPVDEADYVENIQSLINNPNEWVRMSNAGMNSAPQFTYERYLIAVNNLFRNFYGQSPLKQDFIAEIRESFTRIFELELNRFWSD